MTPSFCRSATSNIDIRCDLSLVHPRSTISISHKHVHLISAILASERICFAYFEYLIQYTIDFHILICAVFTQVHSVVTVGAFVYRALYQELCHLGGCGVVHEKVGTPFSGCGLDQLSAILVAKAVKATTQSFVQLQCSNYCMG
jgi:hypothetical protein